MCLLDVYKRQAQGSNGVVLITTKRGKAGEAKFTYDGMFAVQRQTKRLDIDVYKRQVSTWDTNPAAMPRRYTTLRNTCCLLYTSVD